jgi:hypothetical protein
MAVSDGRTAAEFFRRLKIGIDCTLDFYATDLCLRVFALTTPGRRTTVVVDESGNLLQIKFDPFVLSSRLLSRRQKWLYPFNTVLRVLLTHTSAKSVINLYRASAPELQKKEILLVCQMASNMVRDHSDFHLEAFDVFQRATRSYSVVRTMNLLNRSYFSDEALGTIVSNVRDSLEEGGIFITGSNEDAGSLVNGGIYRKCDYRFELLYCSGAGSPINDLIRGA